ncbi:hypothetical protein WA026_010654 [Henosepilachna vigintioctopunctata]|uniref:Uncharacterized protein n=1 Tax=Henosepilachna vigintioctopunctata TaxID=420089 RepID=A0AAW1UQN7_9CUCU
MLAAIGASRNASALNEIIRTSCLIGTSPTASRLIEYSRIDSEPNGTSRNVLSSDRLPSGERYQGVSERYPLGERPQTSVSSDRLVANQAAHVYQGDNRYITYHRYPERYTPVGSLERQHPNHDRYSRAITPSSMEIYNTLATDKDRDVPDRYFDRYSTISHEKDRFKGGQYVPDQYKMHNTDKERKRCSTSNDRYISVQTDIINDRQSTQSNVCPADRFSSNERHKGDKRERSGSGDRKSRYQYQHEKYVPDNFQNDRFPPIPCPEGFASQDGTQFNESSYLEPPSPAPASDRFIPPPPLSPETPTSPICYSTNELNACSKISDRFVSPPQHVNSTQVVDNFSPNKTDRRYQYSSSERYNPDDRFKDIQYGTDRYQVNSGNYNCSNDKYAGNERYEVTRYGPQNPHIPVERYVPQQQPENYYGLQYDRYSIKMNSNDPYMRRDLSNFQFRLPIHLNQPQYQKVRYISTPSRTKCCQYSDGYHLSKSSPGSSSSSSVTSQNKEHLAKEVPVTTASCVSNAVNASLQDIQCQNLKTTYQQEKATQCVRLCNNSKECVAFVSPNMRVGRGRCRHSICVSPSMEYMGSNGNRYICATPPPRNSVCSQEGVICNEGCCAKRGQTSLTVAIW